MVNKIVKPEKSMTLLKPLKIVKSQNNPKVLGNNNVRNNSPNLSKEKIYRGKKNKGLSAAEIIGGDNFLMSQIIRMIPKRSERGNLKLTSKRFYLWCNSKTNYKPFQKLLEREPSDDFKLHTIIQNNSQTYIKFVDDILAICIPHCDSDVLSYLEEQREFIELNRYRIKTMVIERIDNDCLDFFGSLNCFENVEVVIFDPSNAIPLACNVFESCSSLKPSTIRFVWLYESHFIFFPQHQEVEFSELFPEWVKTVQIDCNIRTITWLLDSVSQTVNRKLETLILGSKFYIALVGLPVFRERLIRLTKYFENIKVIFSETQGFDVTSALLQNLSLIEVDARIKQSYDITIYLYKFPHMRFNPEIDELPPDNYDARLADLNFLNLHHFRVHCNNSWKKSPKFYVSPFPGLCEKMKNLTTFEFSMRIINSTSEFSDLVKKLSVSVRHVKLTQCEKLKNTCIEALADSCKQITCLSLEHIKSNVISIKKVISLFKNVKFLSIFLLYHGKNMDALRNLVKINNESDGVTFNWPNLYLLQLVFNAPRMKDKKFVEEIERKIPRKSGQFLIKYHSKDDLYSSEVMEILLQKSTSYYGQFIKLFSPPAWI